ncbi:hypothetical protein G6553_04910 [Nocardioides sp. IC4_145]|uniref:hypothetical protein n=1 Tax=Nocardioides sp. IC4_145 TaxID=2714037 RepID=UPI00140894B4|nr:hypothetical protein [Nocardioides sp. IC4_145]NHC22513.1 hypothetical protein [Nocardioides sp. IC4_145]
MATWGGRPAACAALLAMGVAVLGACAEPAVDEAQDVRAQVGRLDPVTEVEVSGPSRDRGAVVAVVLEPGTSAARAVTVVRGVARAAAAQGWSSYRLELRDARDRADVLLADETLRSGVRRVLADHRRVADAVLGAVTWRVETSRTTVAVDAGGGLLHDAQEAGRTTYGDRATTWRFSAVPHAATFDRKVGPLDLELLRRVQRSLVSPSLRVPAARWELAVHDDVLLDVTVDLPGGPVLPSDLVPDRYAPLLRPLALAARAAVAPALDLSVTVRLRQAGPVADVFAWWTNDHPPVQGRDPLARGWDRWLAALP